MCPINRKLSVNGCRINGSVIFMKDRTRRVRGFGYVPDTGAQDKIEMLSEPDGSSE